MRLNPTATIEKYRIRTGPMGSPPSHGANGAFSIPTPKGLMCIIVSDGSDWEHVSVSFRERCPTWDEMQRVKEIFWPDDEVVMQLHPAKVNYRNCHPFCLHLWRPLKQEIPLPDPIFVGPPEEVAVS